MPGRNAVAGEIQMVCSFLRTSAGNCSEISLHNITTSYHDWKWKYRRYNLESSFFLIVHKALEDVSHSSNATYNKRTGIYVPYSSQYRKWNFSKENTWKLHRNILEHWLSFLQRFQRMGWPKIQPNFFLQVHLRLEGHQDLIYFLHGEFKKVG